MLGLWEQMIKSSSGHKLQINCSGKVSLSPTLMHQRVSNYFNATPQQNYVQIHESADSCVGEKT